MFTFKKKNTLISKTICLLITAAFMLTSITSPADAQMISGLNLPAPGTMVSLSPNFTPPTLLGLKFYPEDSFKFDFIVDNGTDKVQGEEFESQADKVINYFLASLSMPEDDIWVNLSPYEKDRIIDPDLAKTELGRDLLAQDYMLKQITASLIYPEGKAGQEFWEKAHKMAYEKFGTTEIPLDTFNKVWVMPDVAEVSINEDKAFVTEAKLKVLLEED